MNNKEKEKIVSEIIKSFDFEKVHKTMVLLEWQWVGADDDNDLVPTIGHLMLNAKRLLDGVVSSKDTTLSACGGLVAYKENDEGGDYFGLKFVLENSAFGLGWDESLGNYVDKAIMESTQ